MSRWHSTYYAYHEAFPKGWNPGDNSPAHHYYSFTKFYSPSNHISQVDFDDQIFTVYHESMDTFKKLQREKAIHSTWDTYQNKIYRVTHKIVKRET